MNSRLTSWTEPEKDRLMNFSKEELVEQLIIAIEIIKEKNETIMELRK